MEFKIEKNNFVLNGENIKIISGAVHYFRNFPCTWPDIFKKLKALGCNCVETYCAWNLHEKKIGEYDFSGILDVQAFLKEAQKQGLLAIVRPGPYICAEWEFGGLPWWLLKDDDMQIRCSNKKYIEHFDRYLDNVLAQVKPMLITNGGNVIMLQCENEYGTYGDDKKYLNHLRDGYIRRGINVPLFTSDGHTKEILHDGCIDGVLPTLNFGSNVEERFMVHDQLFPDVPKMCMELWNGWFDHWGEIHHTTDANAYAKTLDVMLKKGNANMYMFIGGTNYGFMNGANHYDTYEPTITSYDYDALLTECGDTTPKYFAVRDVIKKYVNYPLPDVPENRQKGAFGKITLDEVAGLLDNLSNLSTPIESEVPKNMESYDQGYGYIMYKTTLNRDYVNSTIWFESLGDRANVYVNDDQIGVVYVNDKDTSIKFSAKSGDVLYVLCENMGRTNFGDKMMRKKGIAGRCLIDGKIHFGWEVYTLPMDDLTRLVYKNTLPKEKSAFFKGKLLIDEPKDTFMLPANFKKGFVVVNGFNVGRFWDVGPQRTLYLPETILKKGVNEIIVFDSDGTDAKPTIKFIDKPILN